MFGHSSCFCGRILHFECYLCVSPHVFGWFAFGPYDKLCVLSQGYVVCPSEKRFLLLFTFLKKNRKKKLMVFFSSCMSVKYHYELLNYIDLPVMAIHVSCFAELVHWCFMLKGYAFIKNDLRLKQDLKERLRVQALAEGLGGDSSAVLGIWATTDR